MPKTCPECHSELVRNEGESATRCLNIYECPAQQRERIFHFASRGGMDIEGFGYQTIVMMIEKEWLRDISDIYFLKPELFADLEGWGEKSVSNLMTSIDDSRRRPLTNFLIALGIPHVGGAAAQVLAEEVGSADKLQEMTADELEALPGVGRIIAESIASFFEEPKNRDVLARLKEGGVDPTPPPRKKEGHLTGTTIVITGSFVDYSRQEATDALEDLGAKVTSSVSKKTDYVVVGADPGSKLDKAQKLGVETLDEKGFKKLIKTKSD